MAGPNNGAGLLVGASLVGVVGIAALSVVLLVFNGTPGAQFAGDLFLTVASGLAAAGCFRAAGSGPHEMRRGWQLVGVAASAWAVAAAIWTTYGIALNHNYPFPSVADIGFVGYVVPLAAGLLAFPFAVKGGRTDLRAVLDAAAIGLAMFFISWSSVLGDIVVSSSGSRLASFVASAYPAVDVVVVSIVLALAMRAREGVRFLFVLLGGGFVVLALTDSVYAARTLAGEQTIGTPVAVGWTVAWVSVGLATLVPVRPGGARTKLGPVRELLPYLPAVGAAAVLAFRNDSVSSDPVLVAVGGALVAVLGWRETLVIKDHAALSTELEAKVADRTQELSDNALALSSARDEALESSRLKSDFLSTMSHEIRTPMNGVIGLTSLLQVTKLDGVQRQYVDGVNEAGKALLAIINEILDFSKIDAGSLVLEHTALDVGAVVDDVATLLAPTAYGKGIELAVNTDPDLPATVLGDANRFRQIVGNLLSNAVKFTAEGEVVVRTTALASGEGIIRIRVEAVDTGIGIPPEAQRRLFQPFSQADASTTRRYGGTGLGLVISAQLVTAMGGEIGMDSEVGVGTTFWFEVPFELGESRTGRSEPRELRGMRVLVVDDNETSRLILGRQLDAWGLVATTVDGGAAALQVLADAAANGSEFELVVLDLEMPEMDGLELARRIGAVIRPAPRSMILLSSGGAIDQDAASAVGITATLTKPVRISQLYDALVDASSPSRGAPAGELARPPRPPGVLGRDGRILVADDNETNQLVAVGMLAAMGYEADVAVNGVEALSAAATTRYAAILMDCHMPEMDGYQATDAIRQSETDRRVPIIAVTASTLRSERERCLAAGMDDCVTKPMEAVELEAILSRLLLLPPPGFPCPLPPGSGSGSTDWERWPRLAALGDDMLATRVAHAYRSEAWNRLSRIEAAIEDGDGPELQSGAHALGGSSATIGADALVALCRQLEALGRDQDLTDATAVLGEARCELERVVGQLDLLIGDEP